MFQFGGPLNAVSKTLAVVSALLVLMTCPAASLMPLAYAAGTDSAFEYTLTEIDSPGGVREAVALATSTPLSPARVQEIFANLKPLVAPASQKMILPEDSLVRPQIPGNVVTEVFPPVSAAPPAPKFPSLKTSAAPLVVSRISHSGNVDSLDQLSLTFSQPLTALGQLTDVNPSKFVTLAPQPPGVWKWAGTQTLLFNPQNGRFPKATRYTVSIPATAASVTGNKIDQAHTYTITTPVAQVVNVQVISETANQSGLPYPPSNVPTLSTTPVFIAYFNQAVDANRVLSSTRVLSGKSSYSLRALSREQLLGRPGAVKIAVPPADSKNWIAFESIKPFEKNSRISVVFEAGLPSAEGPLLNQKAATYTFQIQGPFKVIEPAHSDAGEHGSITLSFTTYIDIKSDLKSLLKITPEIDLMTRSVSGNQLYIGGNIKPLTRYEITLNGNLTDVFGQKLGKDVVVQVQTAKLTRSLEGDVSFKAYTSAQTPRYKLWAQGAKSVRVEIRKVDAADYLKFRNQQYDPKFAVIGKVVHVEDYDISAAGRQLNLDLKKYLAGSYGHLLVKAELLPELKDNPQITRSWIECTDISLDVFNSRALEVLATDLRTAKPLSGVELQLLQLPMKAKTDSHGRAVLPRQTAVGEDLLIARNGTDSAIVLPEYGSWAPNETPATPRWYSVSDRNLYKPGETVKVKGWLRQLSYTDGGGVNLAFPDQQKLSYKVFDSQGSEISTGLADIDTHGGFTYEVSLPDKLQLGTAQIQMKAGTTSQHQIPVSQWSADTTLTLMVEEFRKPEFEMTLKADKNSALFTGDSVDLTASAQYLVGGPLSSSTVDWTVTPSPATFAPPGWDGFNFGHNFDFYDWMRKNGDPRQNFDAHGQKKLKGTTDSSGKDSVQLKFLKLPPCPFNFSCQATVLDVNRQSWSDTTTMLVHPATVYVGLKKDKPVYYLNDKVNLEVVACDLDGKIQNGAKVNVTIKEVDGDQKETAQTREVTIGAKAADMQFQLARTTTSFTCTATVKDSAGRENNCVEGAGVQMPPKDSTKLASVQTVELTADKAEYKPGDVAEITIKSPFAPAKGLVIITRNRNISSTELVMNDNLTVVKVPITDDHYPTVRVEAFVAANSTAYGSGNVLLQVPPKARALHLTAEAASPTAAPGDDVTINVTLADSEKRPVSNNQVALAVVDESVLALTSYKWQNPLGFFYPVDVADTSESHSRAYSVVAGADEAPHESTVRITDYDKRAPQGKNLRFKFAPSVYRSDLSSLPPPSSLPSPLPGAPMVGRAVDPRFGQSNEVGQLADYAAGGQADGAGSAVPKIALRQNFASLAIFKPVVTTDANGKAQVIFKLPDNVTRYRVMAVAVGNTNLFGASESVLTAQMPLMVKPSPPRFMQVEDRCELPVVIQNQTDHALRTEVALRAENARVLEAGKLVTVPANDRVEVRFATVATGHGLAQFQCAAISGQKSDAAEFSFPVMVPASSESFAAYGVLDDGMAVQKLEKPHDVYEKFGGLTVETSSTAVQSLTDAYIYLRDYPYSCSEQLSSRLLAMLALQDSLTAFGILKGDEKPQYQKVIQNDISVLEKRQRADGGFGLWTANEDKQWPYVSIQVTQVLGLAHGKNYKVSENCLSKARQYLKNIEQNLPADYPEELKIAVIARALQVRHLQKDDDPAAAKKLLGRTFATYLKSKAKSKITAARVAASVKELPIDQLKNLISLEMASWLLVILDKDQSASADAALLRDFIQSQIKETASTASANERGYGDEWNYCIFASPRRTDAAVLDALMEDQPTSSLVPKFVKGLLAHRRNGLWEGTQENGYILQVLDRYFNTYEKKTPDFTVQAWLGDTLLANHKFAGRSVDRKVTQVPMTYLLQNKADDILINKEGPGRLYYRLALDYVSKDLKLKALEQGFTVSRQYSATDAKDDVQKDESGVWHFKAGSTVRVKVSFNAPGVRYHVAMADPVPAGAEILNSALRGTESDYVGQPRPFNLDRGFAPGPARWWGRWYEHDNLRDHQAEAFTSLLNSGSHEYSYTIRATTPGRFTVPPTKVEEMYMSETFGRNQTETVIIE